MPDLAVDDGLEDAAAVFAGVRRRLFGIAYRLLGAGPRPLAGRVALPWSGSPG